MELTGIRALVIRDSYTLRAHWIWLMADHLSIATYPTMIVTKEHEFPYEAKVVYDTHCETISDVLAINKVSRPWLDA